MRVHVQLFFIKSNINIMVNEEENNILLDLIILLN